MKSGLGHAELRFRRIAMFAIGVSLSAFLITDLAVLRAQLPEYPSWWAIPAVVGQIVGTAAFLVVPWVARGRGIRVAALTFAIFGILTIALIVPAAGISGLPDSVGAPWPLLVQVQYALAAMLALPARFGWGFVAGVGLLAGNARWLTPKGFELRPATEDLIVTSSVTVALAIVILVLFRAGRELDRAARAAIEAVRQDSAAEARAIERRRVELLAHDEILYVLRVVATGVRSSTTTLARLADAALAQLEAIGEESAAHDLESEEFLRRLRGLATEIAPLAVFHADRDLRDPIPAGAATAILDAAGEALRNSVAHAGSQDEQVARAVRVRNDGAVLYVSISDDGRGFRMRDVPTQRLGVSRSIVERMRAVPGGSAIVHSAPESGTRVELSWRRA